MKLLKMIDFLKQLNSLFRNHYKIMIKYFICNMCIKMAEWLKANSSFKLSLQITNIFP